MFILLIILIPFVLSLLALAIKKEKILGIINAFGYAILFGMCLLFTKNFISGGSVPINLWKTFYIDSLSVFFILTTAIVALAASIYSVGYIGVEVKEGVISARKAGGYFHLFNLFCFTMLVVPLLNNLAMVWITIEMTTLVSAFLVGFHNVKESIEAAWKYIIICSVGITFALLGVIFFYYTSSVNAGINSLNWTRMIEGAHLFDHNVVKIAFLFIIVGYGTKAGLAPMHNWLPDAHSQALSPISGLLSGVLLKISLYAILRFVILANIALGYAFCSKLLIIFGLFSVAVAAGFILVQRDLKRLLAYSSVENIGLATLGIGLGPYGGIFAGLLHIFNHAVVKAFMFFCAGEAVRVYRTNSIFKIRGMLQCMPFTAVAMFLGLFALVGLPPFAIFISKLSIIISAFKGRYYFVSALMLIFIALAFAGLLHHITRVILGNKPQTVERPKELLSTKIALLFLGIFILGLGLWTPPVFCDLLTNCQKIIFSFAENPGH